MAHRHHKAHESTPGKEWFQSAVIYELDVKNIQDSNGDGVGDFRGLIQRLDYIASLGVECVWLQPFYKTPNRDNGYDIADYYEVDPRFGSMHDFEAFVEAAHQRKLRVIADLPLNHVSDEHPWFISARSSKHSPYREWFVWSEKLPKNPAPYPVFGALQNGNWEWCEQAGAYYFHTFYQFMPDLNMANPEVEAALIKIAQFWMRKGLSGFRLDAVPFLIKDTAHTEHLEEPHKFLRDLHSAVRAVRDDAILLAEANLKPKEMRPYFGDGDEMHLLLNFYLCNHIFLSMATGDARHIERSWDELPPIPPDCQWANFIRNHDELSLDQLTKKEQKQVFEAFAPEKDMLLYDRGIRRRLAPMLNGDLRRIKLIYSLLLTLPGTPVINAGEELGLGDDLSLKERESGRTPMQWAADAPNGGFSTAPREKLIRPVVADGEFGYPKLNVKQQDADPDSLLNFMRHAIRTYEDTPALGMGDWTFLKTSDHAVLAHAAEMEGSRAVAVHNLVDEPKTVKISKLPEGELVPLLSDVEYPQVGDGGSIELRPYGFRWFTVKEQG